MGRPLSRRCLRTGFYWLVVAMLAGGLAIPIGRSLADITPLHPIAEWMLTTGAVASLYAGLIGLPLLIPLVLGAPGFMLLPFWLVGITAALSIKEHLDAALAWLVAASALALLYALAWMSRGAALRAYWRIWMLRLRGKGTVGTVMCTWVDGGSRYRPRSLRDA